MAILKKYIFPLLASAFLTDCDEVFTPDMPHKPVLSINSLIINGEPIEVHVSRSRLYTDNSGQAEVTDADVRIYADGQLQLDSYIPRENDNIKIVAESPVLGRAESDVTVPGRIPALDIKWEAYDVSCGEYCEYFGEFVHVNFKLKVLLTIDDPKEENYYKLTYLSTPDVELLPDGYPMTVLSIYNFQYEMEPIFSEHIGIFESIMGGDAYGFTFFSDRQFSGKAYTLNLQFNNCNFHYYKGEVPDCKVHFVIHNISPSYYNWANYIWQRENGALNELGDIGLGDPIWGYSNVSSGAGVIAAESQTTVTLDLTDFIRQTIHENIK